MIAHLGDLQRPANVTSHGYFLLDVGVDAALLADYGLQINVRLFHVPGPALVRTGVSPLVRRPSDRPGLHAGHHSEPLGPAYDAATITRTTQTEEDTKKSAGSTRVQINEAANPATARNIRNQSAITMCSW